MSRTAALRELIDEVVATFHRLHAVSAELHGEGAASAGRRGVLRGLLRSGPQTVPQMARTRPVSRQYIQALVDELVDDGLVELLDNPAHARSRLVRITAAGRRLLAASEHKEAAALEGVARALAGEDIARAARLLRALRAALELQ